MMDEMLKDCKKAYEERDYSRVILTCDSILEKDKTNQIALGYKILSLGYLQRNEEEMECIDHAIMLWPDNYRFHLEKGETLLWAFDDVDGAIECYEKGLSMVDDFEDYWFEVDNLVIAMYKKADGLIESGNYSNALDIYDRILFYKPIEFNALEKIESIAHDHGIDFEKSKSYNEAVRLRERSRERVKKIDDCLSGIEIGEYDEDYVKGFAKFKDYNSLNEYIRDLIICLMESYPYRSEDHARSLVKCNMDYIRSSYEHKEPVAYCSIEVGYCCG